MKVHQEYLQCFESSPNPFTGLEAQYLQSKYIEKHFGEGGLPSELEHEPDSIYNSLSSAVTVLRPTWVKVYGEEYHRNDFVHLGWQLNDLPLFTKVKDILVIGGLTFFQVESTKLLG
ncbi:uncharacterized protein [Dysidea avara]|uniref:uncharacterized protein isoform X1 n=1 Tax=Dysidea avara TaxID=196820 RepID=UPI0033273042